MKSNQTYNLSGTVQARAYTVILHVSIVGCMKGICIDGRFGPQIQSRTLGVYN